MLGPYGENLFFDSVASILAPLVKPKHYTETDNPKRRIEVKGNSRRRIKLDFRKSREVYIAIVASHCKAHKGCGSWGKCKYLRVLWSIRCANGKLGGRTR